MEDMAGIEVALNHEMMGFRSDGIGVSDFIGKNSVSKHSNIGLQNIYFLFSTPSSLLRKLTPLISAPI